MPVLSDTLKKELLALNPDQMTVDSIAADFGWTVKKGTFERVPPKYDTRATVHLKAGEYTNKKDIDTTVGIILFNKLMVEGSGIVDVVPDGFFNEVVTKKKFSKLMKYVSDALLMEKIQINPTVADFLRNYENWGLRLTPIFAPSYTMGMVKPNPELQKAVKEGFDKADLQRTEDMIKLEDNLVAVADKVTKRDPGKTLFDSGARGSFENDFKNMTVFIGPVKNPVNGEYDFMTSNYMNGLKKEDLVGAGNLIVNAEFPKAISTGRSGYLTKQLYAVLQTMFIDEDGTDCGSTVGIRDTITEANADLYEDQYVMTTKGPLLLTSENIDKFIGKKCLIRSPMGCKADTICSVCAGKRLYRMGTRTMGLLAVNVSSTFLNKNLKLRHSMKMNVDNVDPDKLVI